MENELAKWFFTTDCFGNYYGLNGDGELVVASGKKEAVFFPKSKLRKKSETGKG